MFHVRLVVPARLTGPVRQHLVDLPTVTSLVVLPGAGVSPPGDVVFFDVAREAVSAVLQGLAGLGVDPARDDVAVALEEVQAAPGHRARLAEQAAPGAPDDAIVWEIVVGRAADDVRSSWSFYAFLCLATTIAAVAVVTDSAVLVVGAMVVGPEFGPVAALAVSLVLHRWRLAARALRLLALGFAAAVALTAVLALLARAGHWLTPADLAHPRPMTRYIWQPDRWSFVVALLAGAAGVLSVTAGRSNVLVGVFISVTTVPAAGNLALALALWVPGEMAGSALQLAVNLVGMTAAGSAVLAVQRIATRERTAPS
ncbi:MAG TPA: DUF389 domain-containing protein [Kineosporiaceae bacterium]|nr:DUF389 domain-containing protein [Kineosporiaceae bacterium]